MAGSVQPTDGCVAGVCVGNDNTIDLDNSFDDEGHEQCSGLEGVLGWSDDRKDADCIRRYGELCVCPGELGCGRNPGAWPVSFPMEFDC